MILAINGRGWLYETSSWKFMKPCRYRKSARFNVTIKMRIRGDLHSGSRLIYERCCGIPFLDYQGCYVVRLEGQTLVWKRNFKLYCYFRRTFSPGPGIKPGSPALLAGAFWDLLCSPEFSRTWIYRLNFAQRPVFWGLRFFNDTFKYHVFAPMWRFQLQFFYLFFTVLPSNIC